MGIGQEPVVNFSLINADSDLPVPGFDPIPEGAVVNLSALESGALNIRINTLTQEDFGSIAIALTGATSLAPKTENGPPWAVWGDKKGDYKAATLALGPHLLTATPYSANKAGGTAGETVSINFTVVSETPPPTPADPVIAITSPLDGATQTEPGNFAITANASDPDGSVTQVEFFANGSSLGIDTEAPFEASLLNAAVGNYVLTAVATDDAANVGASSPVTVEVEMLVPPPPVNPVVTITSPLDGATQTEPGNFAITANASDPDGSVTQVEFFANGSSLGIDTEAPFEASLLNAAVGNYVLTAIATDDAANVGASSPVTVEVEMVVPPPPVNPVVTITSPLDGATQTEPGNFAITASASDPDGSVTQVEFFANGSSLGIDTEAPYEASLLNAVVGSYALTAVATDNSANIGTSSPVTVQVEMVVPPPPINPVVTITSPLDGSTRTEPGNFAITATASDADGSVAQVEFFANGSSLGIDTEAPFEASLANAAVGNYVLTAVATDDSFLTTTSDVVTVEVQSVPGPDDGPTVTGFTLIDADANVPVAGFAPIPDGATIYLESLPSSKLSIRVDTNPATDFGAVSIDLNGATTLSRKEGVPPWALRGDSKGSYRAVSFNPGSHTLTAIPEADGVEGAPLTIQFEMIEGAGPPPPPSVGPVVAITSPLDGATQTEPGNFAITASASDADGSVTQLEFFANGNSLGIDTEAPFEASLLNAAVGSYVLTAVATDDASNIGTSSPVTVEVEMVVPPPPVNPVVTITSPLEGATQIEPGNFAITANASDPDGSVTQVEFFANGSSLGIDTEAPYEASLLNAAVGTYVFTAVATDDAANLGTSSPVTVEVEMVVPPPPVNPVVVITSPLDGETQTEPGNFAITANASDPDGSVTRVEFFANGSSLGVDTEAPYEASLLNAAVGNYVLTAVATDDAARLGTSSPVTVEVEMVVPPPPVNPVVAITSPLDGEIQTEPGNFAITASAGDPDGSVTQVEFFANGSSLGIDTEAPYEASLLNAAVGNYVLTAVATDDAANLGTSSPVTVEVEMVVPPPPVNPVVAITSPLDGEIQTEPGNFAITANASDPDGSVTQVEFFANGSSLGIDTEAPYEASLLNAAVGSYVLTAVATDDASNIGTSSPVTVEVEMVVPPPPVNPVVAITSPLDGEIQTEPGNFAITANASDPDGSVTQVEFFANGSSLGIDTEAPYEASLLNAAVGTYVLTAIATDDFANVGTSSPVTVEVETMVPPPPTNPVVTITSPLDGATQIEPGNFAITASASDPDGSVAQVEFFANDNSLGIDTEAPYEANLLNAMVGSYVLTAVVTDDVGNLGTSTPVTVEVGEMLPPGIAPVVIITAPLEGASLAEPATFLISATADDEDGVVTQVEFFSNGDTLGIDTEAPYEAILTNVAFGEYELTAEATDETGNVGTSESVTVQSNRGSDSTPVVAITSPANGTVEVAPAELTVVAAADASIDQVEFFANGTSLGVSSAEPFSISLSGVAEGSYTLTAVATDIDVIPAVETTSEPVYVQVVAASTGGIVSGEFKQWHRVAVTFDGPETSETAIPNPFLDYRLDVTFTGPSGQQYNVPGFYAADGNAANTSADSGNKWRVRFSPDEVGEWTYAASFRTGPNVAVEDIAGGLPTGFNGAAGSFTVAPSDKSGRDFRSKGRLNYIGGHYLQFAGNGEYFLKQGADSPENLLSYFDFDGSFKTDGIRDDRVKTWSPHIVDWKVGDPTWGDGKGKGLIGAINYLASEGMNSFSFLTMNINGDDRNAFPYLDYDERVRMDVSRLDQWEVIFAHGTSQGMFLHFKTQETENELLLDGGNLGPQRKLYYRELVARFGHHLALNWNLGEEVDDATTAQKQSWAQFFKDIDPYDHHRVIHNGNDRHNDLLGPTSELTGFSLQTSKEDLNRVYSRVKNKIEDSVEAGKPWAVACDEPADARNGLRPDANPGLSHEFGRKNGIWATFLAGGWGNEWYFGYDHPNNDITLQDFRSRDNWWDYCRHALNFFKIAGVPYWEMVTDSDKISFEEGYCFLKENEAYIVYLKDGGAFDLDLSGATGSFFVRWYDPRNGGVFQEGSVMQVTGGGLVSLGTPPVQSDPLPVGNPPVVPTSDWVVLLSRNLPTAPDPGGEEATEEGGSPQGDEATGGGDTEDQGVPVGQDSDGDGTVDGEDLLPNDASSVGPGTYTILIPVPTSLTNVGEGSGTLILAEDLTGQLNLTMGDGSVFQQEVTVVDGAITLDLGDGAGGALQGVVNWNSLENVSDFDGSDLQWVIDGAAPIPLVLLGSYFNSDSMENLLGTEVDVLLEGSVTQLQSPAMIVDDEVTWELSSEVGQFDAANGSLEWEVTIGGQVYRLQGVYFSSQRVIGGLFHDFDSESGVLRIQPSTP